MPETTDFGELVELPSGDRLFYRDPDHSYWRVSGDGGRGKRLPSVSSIVGPYSGNADGLLKWASDLTLDGVAQALKGQPVPETGKELADVLAFHELAWKNLRDQAAQRGNAVHAWLEAMAGIKDFPSLEDASQVETQMIRALELWWEAVEPDILQSEQVVYSALHGYAGRFDLRFKHGEQVVLLDLKTSKWISPSNLVQLAGYDLAAEECGIGRADVKVILQVKPDGSWKEVHSSADDEDFLNGLRIYRRSQELTRAAR